MPAFCGGCVALVVLLFASRSLAATLDLSVTVLTYVASGGVANSLTVSLSGGNYTIDDPGEATISLGAGAVAAGCIALDANTIRCPRSQIGSWNVSLLDQNDTANLSAVLEPTTISGGQNNDTLVGGAGTDTFTWVPGDGSDSIDGGPGVNALTFSGANINEHLTISAIPGGFQLTRDVANIVLSATNIGALSLQTMGGDDTVTTVPLPTTSQTIDGGAQTATDTLSYDAGGVCTTETANTLQSLGGQAVVFTNFEAVNLLNQCTMFPATLDLSSAGVMGYTAGTGVKNALTVSRLSGTYIIDDTAEPAITLGSGAIAAGCANVDANTATCPRSAITSWNVQLGDQDDSANLSGVLEPTTISGGQGSDTLVGGAGQDTFLWAPGDQSDLLDGGPGVDTLAFSGANINEHFAVSAIPGGFQLTRDVANVVVQASNVETLSLQTLGGDDVVSTVPLATTTQIIDGGAQNATDTVSFDAGGACTIQTPGSFETRGGQLVTFTSFETVSLLNQCPNPTPVVPMLGATTRALLVALLGIAGWNYASASGRRRRARSRSALLPRAGRAH
jgi:hypothetical protein